MKGRIKWAIMVLCGLNAVIAIPGVLLFPQEPVYQGKPLSYWLDEVNRAGSMAETALASAAVQAMGTNSLPFLLRHMGPGTTPERQRLAKLASKQSLVSLSFLEPDPLRHPSLWAIRKLGADAKPLIPDLIKLLEDSDRAAWCGEMGLWAIGPESKPALAAACQSTNERVRATAALLIARVSVKDDGWAWGWHRWPASGKVRFGLSSGVVTEEVVDALGKNLKHPEAPVRRASAEALKKLGGKGIRAARGLLVALKDVEPVVREAAADALEQISPDFDRKASVE